MRDDAAAIGIGTVVVFVATALVAAVAAGILITAGSDVEKRPAQPEFQIAQVIAVRDAPSDAHLRAIDVYLLAHAPLDLDATELSIQNGAQRAALSRDGPDTFTVSVHRDQDDSMESGSMGAGDIAVLRIDLQAQAMSIGPGDVVSIRVDHAGAAHHVDLPVGMLGDALVIPL